MTELTVDYDVWVDPANVGDHQMLASAASRARATSTPARRARSGRPTPRRGPGPASASSSATAACMQNGGRLPRGPGSTSPTRRRSTRRHDVDRHGLRRRRPVRAGHRPHDPALDQPRRHELQLPRPLADLRRLLVPRHPRRLPGLRPGRDRRRGRWRWPRRTVVERARDDAAAIDLGTGERDRPRHRAAQGRLRGRVLDHLDQLRPLGRGRLHPARHAPPRSRSSGASPGPRRASRTRRPS